MKDTDAESHHSGDNFRTFCASGLNLAYFFLATFLTLSLWFEPTSVAQAESIPTGSLKIAYRQAEDGKMSRSVHHVELDCGYGECSITTLTLNRCGNFSFGKAFYPVIERSSTLEGNLNISVYKPGVLVAEELRGGAKFTYRFEYVTRSRPELAKTLGFTTDKFFDKITGFSGAAVKNSVILGKVISWQFSPLSGKIAKINLDCTLVVDGLPGR